MACLGRSFRLPVGLKAKAGGFPGTGRRRRAPRGPALHHMPCVETLHFMPLLPCQSARLRSTACPPLPQAFPSPHQAPSARAVAGLGVFQQPPGEIKAYRPWQRAGKAARGMSFGSGVASAGKAAPRVSAGALRAAKRPGRSQPRISPSLMPTADKPQMIHRPGIIHGNCTESDFQQNPRFEGPGWA